MMPSNAKDLLAPLGSLAFLPSSLSKHALGRPACSRSRRDTGSWQELNLLPRTTYSMSIYINETSASNVNTLTSVYVISSKYKSLQTNYINSQLNSHSNYFQVQHWATMFKFSISCGNLIQWLIHIICTYGFLIFFFTYKLSFNVIYLLPFCSARELYQISLHPG